MSALQDPPKAMPVGPSPRNSSVALLPERRTTGDGDGAHDDSTATSKSAGKRRFFGLGRKKDSVDRKEDKPVKQQDLAPPRTPAGVPANATAASQLQQTTPLRAAVRPISPRYSPPIDARQAFVSTPQSSPRVYASSAASPSRGYRSSSPRLHSPASSQIFERNVQESTLPGELSPAIPSHIQTEDHIPPVLEASAQAITDDHLNPDEVEIVMHAAHQSAVSGIPPSTASTEAVSSPTIDEVASKSETDDGADGSNYGSFDKEDVRRLSFISFADVVQAEHAETSRDSIHHMSLSSTANRSPSPVRSPASSRGVGTSPPTSGAPSMKGIDAKAPRVGGAPASPTLSQGAYSPPLSGGELMVETMRQALRKTGSGDLSGARSPSQPMSAASLEPEGSDRPPFR
ncbi:uncharacterized protein BKCO1_20000113 [Diplodia corticola]|uniref:Uncharacterized protein n=1 Tax=Diplodia corticola TaxID=236234 RepID=A0A1J9S5K8_9PEZI|nr:uncharacterized protein BKCO1_20000113 [Diplodia corticola]OJD34893.1 hypothetical protein BKCO1_20000113 [Diplodia corticola]